MARFNEGSEIMAFNIDEFRTSQLASLGFLRSNQYNVIIPMPPGFRFQPNGQGKQAFSSQLILACDSINIPMTGAEIHGVRRYGYGIIERKPVFPNFGNLQCTFFCDSDSDMFRYFHEWVQLACNYNYGGVNGSLVTPNNVTGLNTALNMYPYELSYKREYAVELTLQEFAPDGTLVRLMTFREAYPILVADARLAWGQLNDIVKVPVMFTFMDWYEQNLPDQQVPQSPAAEIPPTFPQGPVPPVTPLK